MEEYEKIVQKVIRKGCRKEANETLSMSTKKGVGEFVKYFKDGKENICCMHLDFLKYELIKKGKMQKGGCFGSPFDEEE